MDNQPQNIIVIGRKRFPIEDKDFKARVVLIDRYNVLTEDTVEAFTEANKFRRLPDDNVATNPAVRFRVAPSEAAAPQRRARKPSAPGAQPG
jgi:hypothetical protein